MESERHAMFESSLHKHAMRRLAHIVMLHLSSRWGGGGFSCSRIFAELAIVM